MKKFLYLLATFFSLQSLAQTNSFLITGELRGNSDGKLVKLNLVEDGTKEVLLDSAIIKNGKFTLKGSLKEPERCQLLIDATPKGKKSSEEYWLQESFFLENANIHFSGHIDSLQSYYWNDEKKTKAPVITGSASEDVNKIYQKETAEIRKELAELDRQYINEYNIPAISGELNTTRGIEIMRRTKAARIKMEEKEMAFIEKYYNTAPAYDLLTIALGFSGNTITNEDIDKLESLGLKGYGGTEKGAKLSKMAATARNYAVGAPYKDFELLTTDGKKQKVSELMKPGKITMLEFWASWCSPCRGEIPHIKHLKKVYGENFHVISISLDGENKDWKKALKEEKMWWPQLADHKAFESEYAKTYNIIGIPYSIVLDGEGKIIQTNLRGAELDMVLEDLKVPKAAPEKVITQKAPVKSKK